uniref:ATP synthase complex subunit 8 n=1 Tax=Phrynobatrachus keniensis TaxID=467738 RepID=S4V0P6_9NEOB|nr:ATP synthase F0 subunit 8 [Phrynobatrachus keniensis]
MPQLLPDPWFYTLFTAWLILIFIAPKKIINHISTNEINPKPLNFSHNTWTWPWQ